MALQALLDSLEAYTGDLDSLNAFTQTATRELGSDWPDKIYGALSDLSDYQKEKLDHAFNYYAATTAWNEIQSYLTHDGPLNYQETVERLPILEHWLAFFGAAGEEVVSSLKSRLKSEGTAAAQDTDILDEPFATALVEAGRAQNLTSGYDNTSVTEQIAGQSESVRPQASNVSDNQIISNAQTDTRAEFERLPQEVIHHDESNRKQNGVLLNGELNTSEGTSFEKTHKIAEQDVALTSNEPTIEPDLILGGRPDDLSKNVADGDVIAQEVRAVLQETIQREKKADFEESYLNNFSQTVDEMSHQSTQMSPQLPQQDKPEEYTVGTQEQGTPLPVSANDEIQAAGQYVRSSERNVDVSDDSLDAFFAATTTNEIGQTDSGQKETNVATMNRATVAAAVDMAISTMADGVVSEDISKNPERPRKQAIPQNIEQVADVPSEPVQEVQNQLTQDFVTSPVQPQQPQVPQNQADGERPMQVTAAPVEEREMHAPYKPQNVSETHDGQTRTSVRLTPESEEEFKVNRVFRQIDFKSAVQAWVSARCIELGYTNNYKYRYYGFLVDVMDRTIEEINSILADETLHDFVERKRQGAVHFLQNQLTALEKESKDAHERITADLSPLPREGLSADDVRKALGQMDLSGEKEYLGPAPDGFEMLEDPYQNLDEATVKKEYAKIEAEADLPPAEPVKAVEPSDLKKPVASTKSASQTPQNGVQRKMSFSFGKKTTPAGSNNS